LTLQYQPGCKHNTETSKEQTVKKEKEEKRLLFGKKKKLVHPNINLIQKVGYKCE
jgi:hypothetical protein